MTDTKDLLICPACGEEMSKVFMAEAGVNVDVCLKGCGGLFFDNREFNKFDEANENINEIIASIEGKTFNSVDTSATRVCPVCNVPMVKTGVSCEGVEIDSCNGCGAKFLDNGELQKIRQSAPEKLDSNVDTIIQSLFEEDFKKATLGVSGKSSAVHRFVVDFVKNFV